MATAVDALEKAQKLHDLSVKSLAGLMDGTVQPTGGVPKEVAMAILRDDIEKSARIIAHYSGDGAKQQAD